uniref:Tc1-like transposase DDE domain-containing protein n=1 Tax=Salarias fasciatus TaxID=181472 RepID=A0A672FA08_SALFA
MSQKSALDKVMMLELCFCSSKIYKEDCLKKTSKFPQSLMIWGYMSGKGSGEKAVVKSSINAQVYIDILDSFLIPSIEKMFGNDEILFQDDNASYHRAKTVTVFLGKRRIQSMSWPANSPDLNPTENLWWKLKKKKRIGAAAAVVVSVRRGEEGAEPKGEALDLPVNLRSHPHLWS